MGTKSFEKAIERFKGNLEEGAIYEAQQELKTVYHRLRSRQKFEESGQLLEKAALLQLAHNQVACATELVLLLIDDSKHEGGNAQLYAVYSSERVLDILQAYRDQKASWADFYEIGKALLRWLHTVQDAATDAAFVNKRIEAVHLLLGEYTLEARGLEGFNVSLAHYAKIMDVQHLASLSKDIATELSRTEQDLLVLRTLLKVLTEPGHVPAMLASKARATLNQVHSSKESLLSECADLLLEAVEKKSLELFRLVRREYSWILDKDPGISPELDKVQSIHFGMPARAGGLESLFGNMLSSLMA